MPSLSEIVESLDARLTEAHSEISSLTAARAALRDNGTPTRRRSTSAGDKRAAPSRSNRSAQTTAPSGITPIPDTETTDREPTTPSPRPAGTTQTATAGVPARKPLTRDRVSGQRAAKKRAEALPAGKLVTMLSESADGLSVSAIVTQANARDAQVRSLLRELEASGGVHRTGIGRGTRWMIVTDEDRIAKRAAELESRRAALNTRVQTS
jgi:hypothetical protein